MKKIIVSIILILFCSLLYAMYIEPDLLTINNIIIETDVPQSYKDLKIIHFSDTLINNNYTVDELTILVEEINSLNPDIVIFTGDLIDSNYEVSTEEQELITQMLSEIEVTLYKFAIYGDNDLKNTIVYDDIINNSNFILLDNETFILFYKDLTPISITGLTDVSELDSSYDYDEELSPAINITLTHESDNFKYITQADIVLAGNSLGGYINIPFYGALIKKEGSTLYNESYYKENNTQLYISNGIGCETFNIRFMNTPSINVYRFE